MNETIEASEGLGGIKKDIQKMQIEISGLKERQVESLNTSIGLQEKKSEAYSLYKEKIVLNKQSSLLNMCPQGYTHC